MKIIVKKVVQEELTVEQYIRRVQEKYCKLYKYESNGPRLVENMYGLQLPRSNNEWMNVTLSTMQEVLNSLLKKNVYSGIWLTIMATEDAKHYLCIRVPEGSIITLEEKE